MELKVRVTKYKDRSLRGFAEVVIDGEYAIHNFTIRRVDGNLIVEMPTKQNKKGEWKDMFHPITQDARRELIDAILKEYESPNEQM